MKKAKTYERLITKMIEKNYQAMQFFIRSPRIVSTKIDYSPEDIEKARQMIKKNKLFVVIHESYANSLNNVESKKKNFNSVLSTLKFGEKLGIYGVLIHIPPSEDILTDEYKLKLVKCIENLFKKTLNYKIKLILENMTRGYSIKAMGNIYMSLKSNYRKRLGFCIDTAHLWGKGIVLNKSVGRHLTTVKKLLHNKILLFHFNGSPVEYGSLIDQHAPIFKSKIPNKYMKTVMKFAKKNKIPLILETKPEDTRTADINKIRKLMKKM